MTHHRPGQGLWQTQIPSRTARGKVRDIFDLGERLLIVATDRISAFDVVMNEPVPGKGAILTGLSRFWLERLPACTPHHLEYVVDERHVPAGFEAYRDQLAGRAMVVRKARVLPVECIVRGYLAGSGWKDYCQTGVVSGVRLPAGLKQAQALPEPIFTPSTKAEQGHDEPLTFEQACALLEERGFASSGGDGRSLMSAVRQRSLEIYRQAAELAAAHGILLADTKFEFGLWQGELILVDEVLTPDSSRFWAADQYRVGSNPPSFDKQFLRDYLESLDWNKQPPPPAIPPEIIAQTQARYLEAYRLLTGETPEMICGAPGAAPARSG